MHRIIADTPCELICDHVNHDGLDNRKQNLRNCTTLQNSRNQRSRKYTTSKYKGVCFNKNRKKWNVKIQIDGSSKHLGYFTDEIDAARAYDEAAKKYYGEFACLNISNDYR